MLILKFLVSIILALDQAKVLVKSSVLECIDESHMYHSTYHAPARQVPFQYVDPNIRKAFLELFRRQFNAGHTHCTPQDDETMDSICIESSIPQKMVDEINDLLPKDATLNSFSDRNLKAVELLKRILAAAPTPDDLLRVAREQLHRHTFNQKTWYYALVSTLLSRQDLNGTLVAWPIDATPDLYVTHSILRQAREGASAGTPRANSTRNCMTARNLVYNEIRFTPATPLALQDRTTEAPNLQRRKRSIYGGWGWGNQEKEEETCPDKPDPCGMLRKACCEGAGGYSKAPPPPSPKPYYGPPPVQYDIRKAVELSGGYHYVSQGWSPPPPRSYRPHLPFFNRHPQHLSNRYRNRVRRSPQVSLTPPSSANINGESGKPKPRRCILYNGTQGATGDENRLWYFREDMLLNQHHWYWHQYFPKDGDFSKRERRGEMFFFVHHSIIARYNAERLSNGLPLVTPLEFTEGADIGPGYSSDLIDQNTGRFWTMRAANTPLSDIIQTSDRNYGFNMKIGTVANAFSTLLYHVKQGYLMVNRSGEGPFPISIKSQDGLSHLGNTVEESPRRTTNPDLYKSVHSLGHIAISVATDPDFRCKLLKGIMSDVAVAMRDPAFFRVHSLVDTLYGDHKRTLPPYQIHGGEWALLWEGVKLKSLELITRRGNGHMKSVNDLKTFWSIRRFKLEEGIDGSIHEGEVDVDICHQHLNHEPFMFKLLIDVDSCMRTVSNRGTVRIFIAPRCDVNGRRFTMEETRQLMFQLDAFPVELRRGRNTITRYSQDSSATKPWSRTLAEQLSDPNNGNQTEYCGCGWPRHLYMPKGTPQGMEFDIFAMVTDFDLDQVLDDPESAAIPEPCNSPYIYCGRPNRKYFDARPMGYPFDRVPYSVHKHRTIYKDGGGWGWGHPRTEVVGYWGEVNDLEEFVSHVPNMQSSVVRIQHLDKVI